MRSRLREWWRPGVWIDRVRLALAMHDERKAKRIILSGCMALGTPQLLMWAAIYYGFGHGLSAGLLLGFAVATMGGVLVVTRHPDWFERIWFVELFLLLVVNSAVSFLEGGLTRSHGQFVWAFVAPLGALIGFGIRASYVWLMFYVVAVIGLALWPFPSVEQPPLPATASALMASANISVVAVFVVYGMGMINEKKDDFYRRLRLAELKNEELLENILPRDVAADLKEKGVTVPRLYPAATIVFIDLVGFTEMASKQTATETVEMLNRLYSAFDRLVEERGLEKIKTIGDCYMAASGVPKEREDHAVAAVLLALAMADCVRQMGAEGCCELTYRVGIHSGPVSAGVIGIRKYSFDVWGDTVNVASRMESHCEPGRIQLSEATYTRVRHRVACAPRGMIELKGRGQMATWYALDPAEAQAAG